VLGLGWRWRWRGEGFAGLDELDGVGLVTGKIGRRRGCGCGSLCLCIALERVCERETKRD